MLIDMVKIIGYLTDFGYLGWVTDHFMLFSTEDEYIDYVMG